MGDTGGKHRWTPACLAAIVFLYFMGIGSTVGAFPELLLQRQCDETTDLVKCKSTDAPDKALMDKCITLAGNNAAAIQKCKSDHAHQQQQHDLYDTAQQNSVSQIKLYYLLPGLAGFATVPGIGLLGDMYGRKPVLILIAAGGVLGLTTLRFVSNFSTMIILSTVANLSGGLYASVACCFASLADISQDMDLKDRTALFGMVESALWFGLLIGPFVGGVLADSIGPQRSFNFGLSVDIVLLIVATFFLKETRWESAQDPTPFSYSRANPFGALSLLATHKTSLGLASTVFVALCSSQGASLLIPFYAKKQFDISDTAIGAVQSLSYGMSAVGLFAVLPRLSKAGLQPKSIITLSTAWSIMTWAGFAVCPNELVLFLLSVSTIMNGLYFPVVRTQIAKIFGADNYGTSLAAVATIQQMTQIIAPIIFTFVYKQTEAIKVGPIHGVAYVLAAGMAVLATVIIRLTPMQVQAEAMAKGEEEGYSDPLLADEEDP